MLATHTLEHLVSALNDAEMGKTKILSVKTKASDDVLKAAGTLTHESLCHPGILSPIPPSTGASELPLPLRLPEMNREQYASAWRVPGSFQAKEGSTSS